jgi:transcriptional regulator with XRE-family HTH domain
MDFGARLRELRERVGLTQSELAEGIAASSYISLLESGKRQPQPDMIAKFAARLGVDTETLTIDQSAQVVSLNLNSAKVALSSGDLGLARDYASQVLSASVFHDSSWVAASVILLQVKSREGDFEGVLDELEQLFRTNTDTSPELMARIGNEIIRVCFKSGNLGMGVQRGEELLRDYASTWAETEVVELMCQLGACHFHRGDTPRAMEVVRRALELAEKCRSPKAMVQSYWQSSVLAESQGNLTLALSQINNAIYWTKLAELHQVLPILNDNASKWMLDLPNPDLQKIHNLAEAAYLDLASQNNPSSAAYTCITLSEVELRQGKLESALMYVRKGLSELPAGIPGPRTSLMSQEAKVLFRMGKIEESKAQLESATAHMETMAPSKELAIHWRDIARVFVEVGLKDRAIYAFEQGIAVSAASQAEQDVFVESSMQ